MTTEEIIYTFPEPFRTAAKQARFSFDYTLKEGMNDHEWLKGHGYEAHMANDCSFYVKNLPNLSPTSYGDWGTIFVGLFDDEVKDGYEKSFSVFCQMYDEGVVLLWRITIYIDKIHYVYNEHNKTWAKYENKSWRNCKNPLSID